MGQKTGTLVHFEKAVLYDKYDTGNLGGLMAYHFNTAGNFNEVAALGDLFLKQNDMDIRGLLTSRQRGASLIKRQVKAMLLMMHVSYVITQNHDGYNGARELLARHYRADTEVQQYLKHYTLELGR
jgi:hypothetical protein